MSPVAVAFSGGIRSGKTTLSARLAERLGVPRASFGDYVRSVAAQRGLPPTRESWQKVGEELVQSDPLRFCKEVLSDADWRPNRGIVVDGIRHISVLGLLKSLVSPVRVYLVYVATDAQVRQERLTNAEGGSLEMLQQHSTEQDVIEALRSAADLEVSGAQPTEVALDTIVRSLELEGERHIH